MRSQVDVVCVGDLFVEYLLSEVSPGTTRIVEAARGELGGTALNVCWYLDCLGMRALLVAPFPRHERLRLATAVPGLSVSRVLLTGGPPDTLIVLSSNTGHQAVYVRAELPTDADERLIRAGRDARQIVLAGSRHAAIRRAFVKLTRRVDVRRLIFSPSYTVYEFTKQELEELLAQVGLVILNEAEAKYVCDQLSCRAFAALAKRVADTLIVTLADQGAELYGPSGHLAVSSLSGTAGDVIGAGDAFLAGYLYETGRGSSSQVALHFASAIAAQVAQTRKVRTPVRMTVARRLLGRAAPAGKRALARRIRGPKRRRRHDLTDEPQFTLDGAGATPRSAHSRPERAGSTPAAQPEC